MQMDMLGKRMYFIVLHGRLPNLFQPKLKVRMQAVPHARRM
jgi:hypothetical protein